MRFNPKLLVALLPLIAASPLHLYENSKRTNDTSGVSVSREDTSTAPAATAVSFEDHELLQPRAAKTASKATCPAKSTKKAKSAKSKAGRWLSGLTRRNNDYGSLSVPTTANPIDKWATDIYTGSNNKEVHIDFNTDKELKPTSLFEKFGDSALYMTLTGLYGCTGISVTSYCGGYMAHFWQDAMNDQEYARDPNIFAATVSSALNGIIDKDAEKAVNSKLTKEGKQKLVPDEDFVPLVAHECLKKDMGAKAFIFTPLKKDGTGLQSPDTVEALKAVVSKITGLLVDEIAVHTYKSIGHTTATAKTNGDGKMMLTYNPKTGATPYDHAYQVHVKKTDNPGVTMAVGDTWTGDAWQCKCEGDPMLVKNHHKDCCPCQ